MIQRIQSLYLFAVIIACACLFFLPLAKYIVNDNFIFLTISGIDANGVKNLPEFPNTIPLLIVNIVLAVMSAFVLFMFKKRIMQIKMLKITLIVNILLIAGVFYYADLFQKVDGIGSTIYKYWAYIPIVSAVCIFMANKAIRKDEAKIRASSRIR